MCVSADPPQEAASVLVPVLREAVTNILKHSSARRCTLDLTADAGQLRLSVSNDVGGDPGGTAGHDRGGGAGGSGLLNLAARLEAAGGRLAVRREDGTFSMTAELPLSAGAPAEAV
jgi:two-component system sensor histidine kinase DesK